MSAPPGAKFALARHRGEHILPTRAQVSYLVGDITSTNTPIASQARAAARPASSCSRVASRCVRQVRRQGPDHWNFYIPAASACRTSQESAGLPPLVVRGRPCRAGASLIVLATFAGALAPILAVPPTVPPTLPPTTPPATPTAEPNAVPNAVQYAAPTVTPTAAPTAATPTSQPKRHHRRLLACHRPPRWAARALATGAARPTCRRYRRQRRHDRQYHRRRRCRRRRRRRRRRCPRRLFFVPTALTATDRRSCRKRNRQPLH